MRNLFFFMQIKGQLVRFNIIDLIVRLIKKIGILCGLCLSNAQEPAIIHCQNESV